jgi:hypothetical protein
MRDLLSSFLFDNYRRLKVGRPLITHAKAGAASAGLSTASPPTLCSTRSGLSVSIPGRVLYLIITGFFIMSILSCSNKNDVPDGILSKEEMAQILTEFYLKEARVNNIHVSQDSSRKLMEYYRFKYAEQTGIPDSIVEASYQYYLSHPVALGEIYDRVIDSLALKEQRTSIDPGPKVIE